MEKKKIVFRADGNFETGLGHLYRLFSLAESLKNDYSFIFVTNVSSDISIIPEDYNVKLKPDDVTLDKEPVWLSKHFPAKDFLVIADGYQFDENYQKLTKLMGYTLVYIDDLIKFRMYADLVINHSPQADKNLYMFESYTQFALGMDYALLRPRFLQQAKRYRKKLKGNTAFVNFGGADSFSLTYKVTKALLKINTVEKIKIVLGAACRDENIFNLRAVNPNRVKIYKNLSEIELIKVMQSCTFAIAPSSTILFELFCIKIPIYSGYFVDNQKNAFNAFKKQKLVFGRSSFIEIKDDELIFALEKSINSSRHLEMMNNQKLAIDGLQSHRHLQLIKQL